jgi:predicted HTH domain antitoxin
MQVTVEIPDDMAPRLTAPGQNPARATLEAVAIEGYRSGTLSAHQTRRLLGFETRYELDGFLKAHNVWENAYSYEDLEQDRLTMQQLEAEGRLKA